MSKDMDLFLENDRQKRLYQRATIISEQLKRYAKESDRTGRFLKQTVDLMKSYQYLSATLPEEYGGENLSLYEWTLMQEKIAEGDAAAALSVGWHLGSIMELREEKIWSEENFDFIAKEVMQQKLLNRASTEKNTGSPTRGGRPETTAVWNGSEYLLNGRKTFTTAAEQLDYVIVSAWVEDEEVIGWFLINMDEKGVSVDNTWDTLGMRGTGSNDLVLENVKVKQEFYVEKQSGKPSPKGWLLHIPACYLGIAKAALNDAIEFAKNFHPNSLNHPIAKESIVRQKIGEMKFLLNRSEHLLYDLAKRWDENPTDKNQLMTQLAIVKVSITNDANRIVDLAMKVAGGRGLSKTMPFERYYRDVRAGLHNPPMEELVLEQLASRVLDT